MAELKKELKTAGADSTAVSRGLVVNALLALFGDEEVGQTAMQVAVKRFYRAFTIKKLETTTVGNAVITDFEYQVTHPHPNHNPNPNPHPHPHPNPNPNPNPHPKQGANNAQGAATLPVRSGQLAVVPSLASLKAELPALLGRFDDISEPVNKLHVRP